MSIQAVGEQNGPQGPMAIPPLTRVRWGTYNAYYKRQMARLDKREIDNWRKDTLAAQKTELIAIKEFAPHFSMDEEARPPSPLLGVRVSLLEPVERDPEAVFVPDDDETAPVFVAEPGRYVYEPNSP